MLPVQDGSLMTDNADADGPLAMRLRYPQVDVGGTAGCQMAPVPGTLHDGCIRAHVVEDDVGCAKL